MAGQYYYDPRPFYGLNMSSNLMPLDELFYKYETVPYWMDQRMAPLSYADYHSKQVMTRGPEVQQFLPYNNSRPELAIRDDIYADAYKRAAPHFAAFGPGYPDQMRQMRPLGSQDDTYLHSMMAPAYSHRGYGAMPTMPTMPMGYNQQEYMRQGEPGHMNNQRYGQMDVSRNNIHGGSNNNKSYNNNDDSYGTKSSKKTSYNNNDDGEFSNGSGNSRSKRDGDYGYGNKSTSNSKSKQEMYNDDYGYGNKSTSNSKCKQDDDYGYGNKSTSNSKSKQEMYNDDYGYGNKSSSTSKSKQDDYGYSNKSSNSKSRQDNDYGYGNKNSSKKSNGESYSNKNSSFKQKQYNDSSSDDDEDGKWSMKPLLKQSKGETYPQGKKSSSKGSDHGYGNSNNMVVYGKKHIQDSSSDEDESYAYTKKASKAGQHSQGVTKVQQHFHGHGHAQQQPKQMFLSQGKYVELKVPLCCDNCERKVTACLQNVEGVESVLCDQWEKKMIVYGNVKPDVVLKRVRRVKKSAELWQQTPKGHVWVY